MAENAAACKNYSQRSRLQGKDRSRGVKSSIVHLGLHPTVPRGARDERHPCNAGQHLQPPSNAEIRREPHGTMLRASPACPRRSRLLDHGVHLPEARRIGRRAARAQRGEDLVGAEARAADEGHRGNLPQHRGPIDDDGRGRLTGRPVGGKDQEPFAVLRHVPHRDTIRVGGTGVSRHQGLARTVWRKSSCGPRRHTRSRGPPWSSAHPRHRPR